MFLASLFGQIICLAPIDCPELNCASMQLQFAEMVMALLILRSTSMPALSATARRCLLVNCGECAAVLENMRQ